MVQKRPFRDTQLLFKRKGPETPIFIVFFGCALSGPRCQKREILKSHPKKGKIWLITEKLFFGGFAVSFWGFFFFFFFFWFYLFVFFFFVFLVFFVGGFKGQVRWPKGPPHLALNPPYFFFCFCFLFFVLFFFVFFGGFKGQVRWPKGPPHLALNPPFLFFLFFCFVFFLVLFLGCLIQKKPCFSPRKGHFLFIFSVSLSFSLSPFGPPSFSVSLLLSLFFLIFFLSSFLSLFLLSFGSLFFSLSFFLSLSSLLFFHERNNIKMLNCKFFLWNHFFFLSFLPFFVSSSFFYLCSFLILSYVFCST